MSTTISKRNNMEKLKNILGGFRQVFRFRMWFVSAFSTHLYGVALYTLKNKAKNVARKKLRELKEE